MVALKDIIKNPVLKNLKLINKNANLSNIVTNIGIVDYEFDYQLSEKVTYYQGDFLLTSLLVAKDDENLFYEIVRALIDFKVSGLAIKNIYYKNIPDKILKLAQKFNFPLFIFDDKLNFEDIIYQFLYELKEFEKINYYEQIIDNLLNGSLTSQKGFELLNLKPNEYYIFLIKISNKEQLTSPRSLGLPGNVYNLHESLLIFCHKDNSLSYYLDYFADKLISDYFIGISELTFDMNSSLQKCLANLKIALFKNKPIVKDSSDFLAILLNNFQNHDYQEFMREYLHLIREDEILLETMEAYIKYEGDIKECAKELIVHENTLRYRLTKAKALVKTNSDLTFYKNLELALTIYWLNNTDFVI